MRHGNIDSIKIVAPPKPKEITPENNVVVPTQEELDAAKSKVYNDVKTLDLLKALKASIARFGLTRSLISFADHDKSLSMAIPEIPSIENLVADKSAKNSTFAVTALENVITNLTINISKELNVSVEEINFEQLLKDAEAFFKEHESTETILETVTELRAFRNSIMKYGLSRSLLSFADYNKNLSTYIPEVPAVESLASDRSISASSDVVSAVEGKIADIFKNILIKIKAHLFKSYKSSINHLAALKPVEDKIKKIVETIKSENRLYNIETAKNSTENEHGGVLPYDHLMNTMDSIQKSQSIIHSILELNIPKEKEDYLKWIEKIHSLMQPEIGMFPKIPNKNGKFETNENYKLEESADKGSLFSHGYTDLEKLFRVAGDFSKTYNSITGFEDLYDKLVSAANHITPQTDEEVDFFVMALNNILEIIHDDQTMLIWMKTWPFQAIKAMADCTEKKKD